MSEFNIPKDVILLSDGNFINRDKLEEYTQRKKEEERRKLEQANNERQAAQNQDRARGECPISGRMRTNCKGPACGLWTDNGFCRLSAFPPNHRTDGLYCPINTGHVCRSNCALYRNGCTL